MIEWTIYNQLRHIIAVSRCTAEPPRWSFLEIGHLAVLDGVGTGYAEAWEQHCASALITETPPFGTRGDRLGKRKASSANAGSKLIFQMTTPWRRLGRPQLLQESGWLSGQRK